uniref:Splicing factor 3A subunit 1 n=1 Tax=Syphacia muris TaxID=451379 RepID=A0A0N5ADX1_9BILA
MPPIVVSHREEDSMNNEASMSGKQIIGIIYPPPDIRTIVDKTAAFVARNGTDFENKIREKEATNPRFGFLSATDPYNAYYQHKVLEFKEGKQTEPSVQRPQIPEAVKEHVKQAEFVPRNPPPPFEFDAEPATINAFDLDLIKLTALFVARNGRQFLTALMNRESRNYQFDFLKPQHSNFTYFTKLVEQYTKVIVPPKDIVEELSAEENNTKKLLENVKYRVGWEKYQRTQKEKEDAELERERLAYSQIDWHDFVVVQTVDFPINDSASLPPFCTPKDVGARILMQQRQEAAAKAAAEQAVEMDVESDSEEEQEEIRNEIGDSEANVQHDEPKKAPFEITQPVPVPPSEENVIIRDYDPKKAQSHKKLADKWIISPLTGERIPADKLQEHVRYNTVDAQYKEQRERELSDRNEEEPVYALGADISKNIGKFAERRTDIFGHGAEQTIIGKKLGEEEEAPRGPDPKLIWDGQQSTIDQTTKLAQQSITLDQQINEIHKQHGYIADPNKERIGPGLVPPPPPTTSAAAALPTSPQTIPVVSVPNASAQPRPPAPTQLPTQRLPVPPATVPQPPHPPIVPPVAVSRPPLPPGFPAVPFPPAPSAVPAVSVPPLSRPVGISSIRTPLSVPMIPVPVIPQPAVGLRPVVPVAIPTPAPAVAEVTTTVSVPEGPPAKRARTEDELESEADWLTKVSGSITVSVQLPGSAPNPDWKLDGSLLEVSMDVAAPVSTLKSVVQEKTGLPTSKQKLLYEGFFLKDASSLAFYNMNTGSVVQLQIKERGGKKK